MDDFPNSSPLEAENWAAEAPQEQKEKTDHELSRIASSVPLIQDVLDWFDKNATQYASVDALGIDEKSTAEDVRVAVLLAKKMKAAFESQAQAFRGQFAKYIQEVDDTKR